MRGLPKALTPHQVIVRAHLGEGSAGPALDPPVTVRAYVEDKTQIIHAGTAREQTSNAQVWLPLEAVAPELSEVTVWPASPQQRVGKVGAVKRLEFPGTPSHQIIYLV